jgi:hypothetical protein
MRLKEAEADWRSQGKELRPLPVLKDASLTDYDWLIKLLRKWLWDKVRNEK